MGRLPLARQRVSLAGQSRWSRHCRFGFEDRNPPVVKGAAASGERFSPLKLA